MRGNALLIKMQKTDIRRPVLGGFRHQKYKICIQITNNALLIKLIHAH